jgi:hypothetical protein
MVAKISHIPTTEPHPKFGLQFISGMQFIQLWYVAKMQFQVQAQTTPILFKRWVVRKIL